MDALDAAPVVAALGPLSPRAAERLLSGAAAVSVDGPVPVRLGQAARWPAARPGPPPARHGGVVCVADARLDDRAATARRLGLTDADLAGRSEAEILLRGYLRLGAELPSALVGAFTFVIWDGRSATLLAARDHFGVRPLFFTASAGALLLATDEATLLDVGGPREVDEEVLVARAVANTGLLLQRSVWSGIRKLPPGCRLRADADGRHAVSAYWRPTARRRALDVSPAQAARDVRALLETAVADAVRDRAPTAAHLSGGLDSSAVAVLAQRALQARGEALAAAWCWSPSPDRRALDDPAFGDALDERHRVIELAASIGAPLGYVDLDPAATEADRLRRLRVEPTESLLLHWSVLRAAADRGVRVLLSGWGGDEAASFNGRGHVAHLLARGRVLAAWRTAAALTRRTGQRVGAHETARQLYGRGVHRLLPIHLRRRREGVPAAERALRVQGLGLETLHPSAPSQAAAGWTRARGREHSARATQVTLLRNGHLTLRMEAWDLAARRFGIEHRYPLLDRRLVEYVLGLPEAVHAHDGWQRWLFREATAGVLPDDLRWGWPKQEPAMVAEFRAWTEQQADAPPPAQRIDDLRRRRALAQRSARERSAAR